MKWARWSVELALALAAVPALAQEKPRAAFAFKDRPVGRNVGGALAGVARYGNAAQRVGLWPERCVGGGRRGPHPPLRRTALERQPKSKHGSAVPDGQRWSPVVPFAAGDLIDIWGTGPSDIYVLERRAEGTTLVHYNGLTWVPEPVPYGGRFDALWGMGTVPRIGGIGGSILRYRP